MSQIPLRHSLNTYSNHSDNKLITLFCNQFATTLPANPVFSGIPSVFSLLELYRPGGLAGAIVEYPVYALYFIDNAIGYFAKNMPGEFCGFGGHEV